MSGGMPMADKVLSGPVENGNAQRRREFSVHTMEITDACREKDIIENLRVFPCVSSQPCVESACCIHPGLAEIIHADINVDALGIRKGFFKLNIRFYYRILAEIRPGETRIKGLALFDKTVILFGGESKAKTFVSDISSECNYIIKSKPRAVIEALEPIILNMRISESPLDTESGSPVYIPESVASDMGEGVALSGKGKRLYVSLGQFSTIRLERDTLLSLSEARYFSPNEQGLCMGEDDPRAIFEKTDFPADEFWAI